MDKFASCLCESCYGRLEEKSVGDPNIALNNNATSRLFCGPDGRGGALVTVRLSKIPGLLRAASLLLGVLVVTGVSGAVGLQVHWETAIVFGMALGISMRWPILLDGTGSLVAISTAVVFEALWFHGLPTAVVLLLLEFGVRIVTRGRFWEWHRPFALAAALIVAYLLSVLVAGAVPVRAPSLVPPTDSAAFVQVYAFWALVLAYWVYLPGGLHGRTHLQEYVVRAQQTWWMPLVFIAVAYLLSVVQLSPIPLTIPSALALIWAQSMVGRAFNTLIQDRALSDLVKAEPLHSFGRRAETMRVLSYAHAIGRELDLSRDELRVLGYAAVLQDYGASYPSDVPRWLVQPPSEKQAEAIRRYVDGVARQIERAGPLDEVAQMIRHRFAAHDGTGVPSDTDGTIPQLAQVLAAANAVAWCMETRGVSAPGEAVQWLRTHAAGRFSPEVLVAMLQAFVEPAVHQHRGGLPQVVHQLRGLVGERPSLLMSGLQRVWLQLRGQTGMAPGLPPEVLAVARMASFFATSAGVEQTAQIAVEAVGELVGGKVALALSDGGEDPLQLRFAATYGYLRPDLAGQPLSIHDGMVSRAILNQEPIQMPDMLAANVSLADLARTEGICSALFVPLVGRDRPRGLLIVGTMQHHWFTPREVGLIHLMAGQAAIALENANLMAEVADRLEHISNLKAFTDTLLDNLTTAIIVLDPSGRLLMTNAAARACTRRSLPSGEPLPPEMEAICPAGRVLRGENVPEHDVPWGDTVLEVSAAPLRDARGELLGAICLCRDVTRVRAMERQVRRVEKLAAIGELAAGAAHEIRNPLTSIRGFIQLIHGRTAAAAEDREFYQIVLNEIDRIDSIIRDLLVLAKPADLRREETDLAALADEVLLLQAGELVRRNVRVRRVFDPAVTPVPVDPKMIRQLLFNLLINAAQAMPSGGTITVGIEPVGPDQVALSVADTGMGILPDNLPRLFVPFFTTKDEGTGLGLALCYSIVQAHGGRIDVDSREGEGTIFTVTLPVFPSL